MASLFGWCRPCWKWYTELIREMCRSQDGMSDLLCRQSHQGKTEDGASAGGERRVTVVRVLSTDGNPVASAELSGLDIRDMELVLSGGRIMVSGHDGDKGYRSTEYNVRERCDEPFRVRRSG